MVLDRFREAFFAYPAEPPELSASIVSAVENVMERTDKLLVTPWAALSIFGQQLPDEVRGGIRRADVLVCDITFSNPNVFYEIGFAIGQGKTIAPVVNVSFSGAVENVLKEGLFDSIGFRKYENSENLYEILLDLPTTNLLELYSRPINYQQPLFLLDTLRKTDFRNAIVSAIKASKTFYRSFDPVEVPRFTTLSALSEVTASTGTIIPFLGSQIDDAARHNLRAAFLAGLSHGLDRPTLLLEHRNSVGAPAADYRDLILQVTNEWTIVDTIATFSQTAFTAGQSLGRSASDTAKSPLQKLSLGSSAAENEFRSLEDYFVETAEFLRTMRGEVSIVAGRKGSGKTAIFFRSRDVFRKQRQNVVIDLKPESHQLSLFRSELLKISDIGVFDHTLAAFWYFVALSEILLNMKGRFDHMAFNDMRAYSSARDLAEVLETFRMNESGDFTSRLNRLGSYVLQEIDLLKRQGRKLTTELLTNVIFRGGIADIKNAIFEHNEAGSSIIFLFDNIDKGWPSTGLDAFDVRMVRLLIEALEKIRRDFGADGIEFTPVVFLRNDIYELLINETPDRGKAGQARIDWTDRAKLKQVILRRLQRSVNTNEAFEPLWARFCTAKVNGTSSFEYFLDHCLMRPRFLINIIENAIGNAINRGHEKIEEIDCLDAVRQHSLYLIDDFGYEIRDVSGISADILYSLVGVTKLLTKEEILSRFQEMGISEIQLDRAFELMLWYGVLGVVTKQGRELFIYDFEYNMKRLNAEIRGDRDEMLYVVNSGLYVALSH